jgi:hypothetical protein
MAGRASLWILALLIALPRAASAPIDAFARQPQFRNVTLSPDGRYVGFISSLGDVSLAMTLDRQTLGATARPVARGEPEIFDIKFFLRSHS